MTTHTTEYYLKKKKENRRFCLWLSIICIAFNGIENIRLFLQHSLASRLWLFSELFVIWYYSWKISNQQNLLFFFIKYWILLDTIISLDTLYDTTGESKWLVINCKDTISKSITNDSDINESMWETNHLVVKLISEA